jgi:hypothetical protein
MRLGWGWLMMGSSGISISHHPSQFAIPSLRVRACKAQCSMPPKFPKKPEAR